MFPIVLFCDNSASYIIVPGSMRNTSRNGVITLNNEKASTKKKKKKSCFGLQLLFQEVREKAEKKKEKGPSLVWCPYKIRLSMITVLKSEYVEIKLYLHNYISLRRLRS